MAQATAQLTYDTIGNKEDLAEVIFNISPEETPMLSRFQKVKAKSRLHEWLTDSLASATENKFIEGADYTFAKRTARTRLQNFTQISVTPVDVSDTQRSVDTAGMADEFAYQMANAMKEHARDIEYSIVNATGNSGASGTAREMEGVLAFIDTNVITGTGTGTEALTETMFNDLLQAIWNQGGRPDVCYANGWQKRKISGFTAGSTKNINASEKALIASVDVYDSDFGRIKIIPDRYMTTSVVAVLQSDLWAIATLRPTHKVDIAKTASSTQAVIETELTLEARNEAGSGQINGLSTS